jgi:hypothetical protein
MMRRNETLNYNANLGQLLSTDFDCIQLWKLSEDIWKETIINCKTGGVKCAIIPSDHLGQSCI